MCHRRSRRCFAASYPMTMMMCELLPLKPYLKSAKKCGSHCWKHSSKLLTGHAFGSRLRRFSATMNGPFEGIVQRSKRPYRKDSISRRRESSGGGNRGGFGNSRVGGVLHGSVAGGYGLHGNCCHAEFLYHRSSPPSPAEYGIHRGRRQAGVSRNP